MSEHDYLGSLKNKEFLLLQKLCDASLSDSEKVKFKKLLEETRREIESLG